MDIISMRNVSELPSDLPRPSDDGAADHLVDLAIPKIKLKSTESQEVDLWRVFQEPTVLFIYPRAGSPIEPNKNPELWDSIPGARGCTPQSCGFRDLYSEFKKLGINIIGLSVQSLSVQREFVERNHISFPVLSDNEHTLTDLLKLPTFNFEGERLIKRMALFIRKGKIQKVFYPVFPPDQNASQVLAWIKQQ